MYWQPLWATEKATWSQPQSENERQQSVNNFVCCILYNSMAELRHLTIIEVLAAFIGNIVCVNSATRQNKRQQSVNRAATQHHHSINRVSTECQRFCALHLELSKHSATAYTQNQRIGSHYEQKRSQHSHSPSLKMSVNRASTILCVAFCIIQGLCCGIYP